MTNEEINKTIHEKVMGECWHEYPKNGPSVFCLKECGEHWHQPGDLSRPDYCSDLNAVHRAERKVIIESGCRTYTLTLQRTVIERTEWTWSLSYDLAITATARQRAEAVLRATGNWVDGNDLSEDARPMVEDGPSAEDQAQHDFMMGL